MKTLYANGDSFVFGMECLDHHSRDEANKEFAFPKIIASELKFDTYINNAYNGASNGFIFRTVIEDLLQLENEGNKPEDIFVLIGWTSLFRTEVDGLAWHRPFAKDDATAKLIMSGPYAPIECRDHGLVFMNPHFESTIRDPKTGKKINPDEPVLPTLFNYFWTDKVQVPQHQTRIMAMHGFLKSRGYKHLFVNTTLQLPFVMLDNSSKEFYNLETETFFDWALNRYPMSHRNENHFDPVPHKHYGEILVDYITKNALY